MTNIFALTTRGLENISTREMADVPGLNVSETAYRRVAGTYEGSLPALLQLRTVDDLYLSLATWNAIRHTRDMLADFAQLAEELNLDEAAANCATVRTIKSEPLFSITASFVGKRNYSADEIKNAAADGILARYDWTYTPDDREADFNIRIFIEHDTAYVGVRLSKSPLHERGYKQVERAGSLKPPVAAAMLRLAHVDAGHRLLDPCCGAGTVLIEGALTGAISQGGDIEAEAVMAAKTNADTAKVEVGVQTWDARELPLADQSVDRIVTNLPWGRQIAVDEALESFYRQVCAEMERVLVPGGRIAVLTSTPHLLRFNRLQPDQTIEISLFGQTPMIVVLR
jgi:tRNA (guanine6-N2)-methyltransferase